MSYVTTRDGAQIYYKDWGAGQPVVFSHGWPLSSDVPFADSAALTAKLVKNARLKVYAGAPHGLCTTMKDKVNADLLEFFRE